LLGSIAVATAVWGARVVEMVRVQTSTSRGLGWFVVLTAAAVLATPFVIGIARCTAALARLLGSVALPPSKAGTDLSDAPRRALVVTLEIAILLLVGGPLIAVTQPFLPPISGPIVIVALIPALGYALWRGTTNLQDHALAGAQAIAEVLSRQLGSNAPAAGAEPAADLAQLHRLLPGLGAPQPIRIRAGSHAVDKTLADLNLRVLTGATVLAIIREHDGLLVPTGREILKVGDLLAVAGTSEAVRHAGELLARPQSVEGE
jgi:CPA2 family monovalent cation:H+ antiporter-2